MKRISFKGASWDSIFLTFVKVLTTLTTILLTKILSVGLSLTDYGTYSQATLVTSIGTSIILFGLGDALNYFYNNQSTKYTQQDRERIVNTIFFIETILGICFAIVVVLGNQLFADFFSNQALSIVLFIVSIKPMLDNMVYFYQVLYVSAGKAKVIAVRNLVISVLKVLFSYISVHIFKDVNCIFVLLILLDIAQLVFFRVYFAKDCFSVHPFKILRESIKPIFAYSLPMGIYAITNLLTRDIDKLVIGRLADTETLAIYTNCSKILPFDMISVSFATVLIPYIMRYVSAGEKEKTVKLFSNYMKIGYYSVWTFGMAVLTVTSQAISFLYTDAYLVGEGVFICYIIDSMIRFASMHLILTASGNAKVLMKYSIITLLLNTVLNIVFYYFFGILGPAIATLLTAVLYTYLVLNKTIKTIHTGWREIFQVKDMIMTIAVLAITGGVVYFGNQYLLGMGIQRFVSMVVSMMIVGIVSLVFNFKKIKQCLYEINTLKL